MIDDELDELTYPVSALAIEGARGVGKTATAARRSSTVRRLDDPAQLEIASADPGRALKGTRPVLLDEWQRVPALWSAVRRAVDDGAPPGAFLLTGASMPPEPFADSGTGRIASVRMRPMALSERGLEQPTVSLAELLAGAAPTLDGSTTIGLERYAEEIVSSGLPGLRELPARARRTQIDAYLDRLAESDFAKVGVHVRRPQTLRRWMAAYAAATASTASYETIRDAAMSGQGATPARTTTTPYRDALERLFLLDPVPAWLTARTRIARLASPPKHHLADPAFAARLLNVDAAALLDGTPAGTVSARDGSLLGALFESLVTLSVRVYAQRSEGHVQHLRTRGGEHEVDLIVERGDGRVLAIETKLARTVSDGDTRHLRWLARQLGDDLVDAIIVTTGPEAYRRADGIGVVPAALLGP